MEDQEPETGQEPKIDQQYRSLNALVRTQAQRDKIKDGLKTNRLDPRYKGFKLQGSKVMYQLENGDTIQLLMTSEDVENQLRTEYDKAENAGKGVQNLYWYVHEATFFEYYTKQHRNIFEIGRAIRAGSTDDTTCEQVGC